jgi:hypothetical protein
MYIKERFLTRRQQSERYNCCTKTIERWTENPTLGFPPEIDINGRRLRKLSDLEGWERKRAEIAATTPKRPFPNRQKIPMSSFGE